MLNCYYSIRMYIEKYPSFIKCQDLMDMADEISDLFGCKYDQLGYMLLHPDYDFKDLGVMLKNNKKGRKRFAELSIPLKYYGKYDDFPDSPSVEFKLKEKDSMSLPFYSIDLEYPVIDSCCLCIKIDIKEELLLGKLSLEKFKKVQDIINSKGYIIDSAFLHYYSGNTRRDILDGGEWGFITVNDWRIIDHSRNYQREWKKRIMDVFYMNSFKKEIVSKDALRKIINIVGNKNMIDDNGNIYFKLPQSKIEYLLNRIISTKSRKAIKKLLEDENVCRKDASIIASVLRL